MASGAAATTAALADVSSSTSQSTNATRCASGSSIERSGEAQPKLAPVGLVFGIARSDPVLAREARQRAASANRGPLMMARALDRDREQERLQIRIAAKPAHRPGKSREHVLHHVLGRRRVRQQAAREHAHALVPAVERARERLEPPVSQLVDERGLVVRRRRRDGQVRAEMGSTGHGSLNLTPAVAAR